MEKGAGSIGDGMFFHCDSLESVEIPASVTSISEDAFYCCQSLTSITIPNTVTSIGNYAFSNCPELTSITVPASVTSIGKSAFYHCENIENVYCYAHPETLTWNAKGNDFKGEEGSKETICHVPAKYYETAALRMRDCRMSAVRCTSMRRLQKRIRTCKDHEAGSIHHALKWRS